MKKRKKRSKLKPLKKFRVYIDRVYYLVYVWRTIKDMRDYRASVGLPRTKCLACTMTYERHYRRHVGEIHFADFWFSGKGSSYYVISHEATHAAVGLIKLAKRDFSELNERALRVTNRHLEETFAELVSLITHKISERLRLVTDGQ